MTHFLILAGLIAAVWTVLALPLAVAIGRRLRHSCRTTTIPGGPR